MPILDRRNFMALTASATLAGGAAKVIAAEPEAPKAKPYNVLFIAVDDMRPEMPAYGHNHIKTPNFDRLVKGGIVFRSAYCQQALCCPTRTSLLTGLRPDTTKVWNNETFFRKNIPDVVTLPQHFKNNGYTTVAFSKIYHPSLNDAKSWSEPWQPARKPVYMNVETLNYMEEKRKEGKRLGYKGNALYHYSVGPAFEHEDRPDTDYSDGDSTVMAIEAMKRLKAEGKPFFLAAGYHKPHLPFVCPKKYADMYDVNQIPLASNPNAPKDMPALALHNWGELRAYSNMPKEGPVPDDLARQLKRAYYACISFTDAQVGLLLDELEKQGLAENTIVILWGDHGWKLGEHGAWSKLTNFEIDTHACLLMRHPGQKAKGAKCDELVEFVDIYPTLCEACGLPLPAGLEGVSFAPLLDIPKQAWKKAAFSQHPRWVEGKRYMGYSMRTKEYRYNRWIATPGGQVVAEELYDHIRDPQENVSLALLPESEPILKKMRAMMDAGWQGAKP